MKTCMNARLYPLLQKYSSSIYVRSWDRFPDCHVQDITPVYTNDDDVEVNEPLPGFKLEFRIKSLNSALKHETFTVPVTDLRLPNLSENYTESSAVDRAVKGDHNALVASHASGEWVVLDDVDGCTTSALRATGITDIIVPNPNIKHIDGAAVYPGLLITLLLNMPPKPKSFYLDYTCSWAGSKTGIMPIVDVTVLLERWLLDVDGVLALTVCMRHLPLEKRRTHLDDIQSDIDRLGKTTGYSFERVHGSYYRNNFMAFLVLKSVRVEPALPAKRLKKKPACFMDETHGGLKRQKK